MMATVSTHNYAHMAGNVYMGVQYQPVQLCIDFKNCYLCITEPYTK